MRALLLLFVVGCHGYMERGQFVNLMATEAFKLCVVNSWCNTVLKKVCPVKKALIVSYGDVGRAVAQRLRQDGYVITAATTKPSRRQKLSSQVEDVICIPQIETQNDDVLTEGILKSDLVVLTDTVKIFSPHTFVRTAERIKKIIQKHKWSGTVGLVSSENAYGCPMNGQAIYEDSPIFKTDLSDGKAWHVNTNVLALQIRWAESALLKCGARCFVLRTAGLWDEKTFFDVALYNSRREISNTVGESFMSYATTNLIAEATAHVVKHELTGIFNVANNLPIKRKLLLKTLHALYGLEDAVWVDEALNSDVMYCLDPKPYLPSSQRSNSKLFNTKLRRSFYYHDNPLLI